ncbi:pyridoxamine 5'-phosphate oxidase family protein [Actinomadura sp. WMMB 499]|uniref:pyridoxamine 5'-phosphate oxidase family protein n=1 Tax=Actinomadura sp. WMMB 499 TaxID=1219491 RepID=UPI0012459382|nr:pyridoxamine 5'-phosphate oxidase family protein [Actinomadura sp. WMMB 499]QFG24684.1 pyridoxamine 5'-phosphate oxidase family protein [Actinomadura sp. WMMB 499]
MNPLSATPRTRLGRVPERSSADRAVLYEILDSALVCHLGVVIDGSPRVIPTGYGRLDDTLYLHGSSGAASLRHGPSRDVCVTVTHLDGIVVARSLFHHSLNYRSAIVYGTPSVLTGDAKLAGLRAITEQLAPGQWDTARLPTRKELAATTVLALPLAEASVKIRQGPPKDDAEDHALDVWAGVLPVRQEFRAPVPDPALRPGIEPPPHITSRTP